MVDTRRPSGPKPKQDYSELVQKPITLKKDIGGLVRPGEKRLQPSEVEPAPPPVPVKKKQASAKKRNASTSVQWTLRGVSASAKEVAVNAASEDGVTLHEWLERAIYQAASASPGPAEPDRMLLDALEDIRQRLERVEQQSGFFYRIWEHLKVLMTKPA